MQNKIKNIFDRSLRLEFDDTSKFVIMSDCHRSDGSDADNFIDNTNIYYVAMQQYYGQGFTYIELGDGDELWESNDFSKITNINESVFELLSKFYADNRLHMVFGNHDIVKAAGKWVEENLQKFFTKNSETPKPLFPNIKVEEGIVLKNARTGNRVFLLHGHQVDFLNSTLWRISRLLVRYIWRPLETLGIENPTSVVNSPKRKMSIEKHLVEYSITEKMMIIAGHTHRRIFPLLGEPMYFNDGCCVYPNYITAIEIVQGTLALVKWSVLTKEDGMLFVGKEVLEGPVGIEDYYNTETKMRCLTCWENNSQK